MDGSSSYIPRGLRMACDKLSTFSRNRMRVEVTGSNVAQPGQIISVVMPAASTVDLHSWKMHADVTTSVISNGIDDVYMKLPGCGSSLIHRSEVSFNGV